MNPMIRDATFRLDQPMRSCEHGFSEGWFRSARRPVGTFPRTKLTEGIRNDQKYIACRRWRFGAWQ